MASIKCIIFGCIAKEKGYFRIIKILERNPKIELLIAGPFLHPLEQETLDYIKKKEKELKNLKVEVRRLRDDEFGKYAKKADIILLPYLSAVPASGIFSRNLKFLKPMITWNTYFFKENEEKYGACITVNSIDELEKAILKVSKSAELRKKLREGVKKLQKDLSWKNVALKYLEMYKTL
jgi:glycosyltransferase involved in cell wall biosynthesis